MIAEDMSLVAAAVAGEREALESIVTTLLPRIRNLVRYLVRGDASAEDISQEAMVAIVRGLSTYSGQGTLQSWADRIAARVVFASLRADKRQKHRDEQLLTCANLHALPRPHSLPDEYTARRRSVEMLDQLPYEQRHALTLHHVLGWSVPEISEELKVPLETVRSRLRIGIAKLRALHGELS